MLLPGQNCKVLKIIKILIVVAINVVFYINFNHFCLIYPITIRLFVSSQTSDSLSSITFETNIYILYTKLVNVERFLPFARPVPLPDDFRLAMSVL